MEPTASFGDSQMKCIMISQTVAKHMKTNQDEYSAHSTEEAQ